MIPKIVCWRVDIDRTLVASPTRSRANLEFSECRDATFWQRDNVNDYGNIK